MSKIDDMIAILQIARKEGMEVTQRWGALVCIPEIEINTQTHNFLIELGCEYYYRENLYLYDMRDHSI